MKARCFFLFVMTALGLGAQSGEELAEVYVAHGFEQAALGRVEDAEGLFRTALEYDRENSDASGGLGFILSSRAPVEAAVPHLEAALAHSRFRKLTRSEVSVALGQLLLRLRDYGRVIRQFSGPEGKSPEELRILHLAYDLSGKAREARAVLEQGMKHHPFWPGWLELALRYPEADPQLSARLRKDFRDTGGRGSINLEQTVRRLPEQPDKRRETVSLLLSTGYVSPGLVMEAWSLDLSLPDTWKSVLEPERVWAKDYLAIADLMAREKPEVNDLLTRNIQVYSGISHWDSDRDGWPDAVLEFRDGQLVRWSNDRDQNGSPEMEVHFSSGKVEKISESGPKVSYEVVYEDYPFIASLTLRRADSRQEYLFPPYLTSWPVITRPENIPSFLEPRYWKWNPGLTSLEGLVKQAGVSLRRDEEGRLVSRSRLLDGEEYLREEDSDGDGRRDLVMEFSGGEVRRIWKDQDGDGTPDQFIKTSLRGQTLWADTLGRQAYDFGISPEGWKIWDFNQDGEPDFRLLALPGKEVLKIVSYRGRSDSLKTFPSWEAMPWP